MSTITKEWLQRLIRAIDSENFDEEEIVGGVNSDEIMDLARIALASLEAEAVKRVNADQMHRVCLEANRHLDKYGVMAKEVNKLLGRSAPPAPVSVPDEATPGNIGRLLKEFTLFFTDRRLGHVEEFMFAEVWNACRAAMLQGGDVTESLTLVKAAPELDSVTKNVVSETDNSSAIPEEMTIEDAYAEVQTGWNDAKYYMIGWNAFRAAMPEGEPTDDERIMAIEGIIPDGLSTVCAEAYQVVGVMAEALGVFDSEAVQKILDNLSQQKLVHNDVLPFSLPSGNLFESYICD